VKRGAQIRIGFREEGRTPFGAKVILRTAISALISIGILIAGVQFLTSSVCYWLIHGLVERGVKGSVTNMPYVSFVVSVGLIAWGAFTLFHNIRLCASFVGATHGEIRQQRPGDSQYEKRDRGVESTGNSP